MKKLIFMSLLTALVGFSSCNSTKKTENFNYVVDTFADLQILRYQVPGYEDLSLKQKELLYYLNQAGLEGMDMLYDQNYKHNLCIKRTLEAAYLYSNCLLYTSDAADE